jgi:hypothetical protein
VKNLYQILCGKGIYDQREVFRNGEGDGISSVNQKYHFIKKSEIELGAVFSKRMLLNFHT